MVPFNLGRSTFLWRNWRCEGAVSLTTQRTQRKVLRCVRCVRGVKPPLMKIANFSVLKLLLECFWWPCTNASLKSKCFAFVIRQQKLFSVFRFVCIWSCNNKFFIMNPFCFFSIVLQSPPCKLTYLCSWRYRGTLFRQKVIYSLKTRHPPGTLPDSLPWSRLTRQHSQL